jgi:hypothetical protein
LSSSIASCGLPAVLSYSASPSGCVRAGVSRSISAITAVSAGADRLRTSSCPGMLALARQRWNKVSSRGTTLSPSLR